MYCYNSIEFSNFSVKFCQLSTHTQVLVNTRLGNETVKPFNTILLKVLIQLPSCKQLLNDKANSHVFNEFDILRQTVIGFL